MPETTLPFAAESLFHQDQSSPIVVGCWQQTCRRNTNACGAFEALPCGLIVFPNTNCHSTLKHLSDEGPKSTDGHEMRSAERAFISGRALTPDIVIRPKSG
jgi:hypothetical protein